MTKQLGIIICNFNKRDYLKGCLQTLFASDFGDLSYDVVVVDNASTDGSAQFVKDNYPQVTVLENKVNTGGSGGFARGQDYAREQHYQYVAMLDNDILLEADTLITLVRYLDDNPSVGVVGSKICTMDNPDVLQEMGSFIDFEERFNIVTPHKGYADNDLIPEVVECDYVPACCLMTRYEVLRDVGSFDTQHFIYWDDMDWCIRAKKAGWKVHSINASRVLHKMGAANHANTFGFYYFERNRVLFFLKHLQSDQLERFISTIEQSLLTVTFFSHLKGNFATPKSLFCAVDDVCALRLGKRDESIFHKEDIKHFTKHHQLSNEQKVCVVLCENMFANRRVLEELSSHNIAKIVLSLPDSGMADNFASYDWIERATLASGDDETRIDTRIIVQQHILEFEHCDDVFKSDIIVDQYLNSCRVDELSAVLESYSTLKSITENIIFPPLKTKLLSVAQQINATSAE